MAKTPTTTLPKFTPDDFKDPALFRFIEETSFYFGKISDLYQPGRETALGANLSTPVFKATGQDNIPTDDNVLITLGTAKKLFSPTNTRVASLQGSFQTGPTTVEYVQPLPNVASAGGGGGGGSAVASIERFTLSAPATVITPITVATVGAILFVFLTQDATGGRQITWATTVKWATINIDVTALTVSMFQFIGDTDPVDSVVRWFAVGMAPMTGQTP